jgi:hypothetical protein
VWIAPNWAEEIRVHGGEKVLRVGELV